MKNHYTIENELIRDSIGESESDKKDKSNNNGINNFHHVSCQHPLR